MSENIKNVPVEEIEETEVVEEVTEVKEKKENILKKGMGWIKSHGKTVAKGAAVAALGVIAYGLGKKAGSASEEADYDVNFDPNTNECLEDSDVTE